MDDVFGKDRVTSKTDPDAGHTTITYDPTGNVTQTTDARAKTVSFTYDPLGRKTGQYAAAIADQAPANQMAAWVYDNSDNAISGMHNPIGHLTSATSYVGGSGSGGHAYTDQNLGFNVWGESTGETITIPDNEGALAGSYSFGHTYTSGTGLPERDIYRAAGNLPAETVIHGYSTALDVPDGLGGLASYTANVTWSAYNRASQAELGGTRTNAYITNTFDPHTGDLTDSKLTNSALSSQPIDETSYTYDPAGNPLHQTETRQGSASETQCFGYDTLDRLVQAWTATDDCAADPSASNGSTVGSGIGGGAYWTSWNLNPLGQRTKQTQHGLSGAGDTVTTYTYDGNGTGQAHTLTKATTTGPNGTTTAAYAYDNNGNTATRTTAGHGQQTLTWDAAGNLTAVTAAAGNAHYIYTADGDLLLQKDPGTTTLYLPGEQLTLDTTTGTITGTRFYDLPGAGQAVRTGSGDSYRFETADQHGTATLTLSSTLTDPVWRQQTPYGAPRGTPPSTWPDNHGFLNKPQDPSTGLTAVGARWYDPATGTFASLDPLFEATDTQQQNGYTYAAANPITHEDPAGTCPADRCGAWTPKPCASWVHGGCGYTETGPVDPGDPYAGYYRDGHFEHGWWDYNPHTHTYGGQSLARERAAAQYARAQRIQRRLQQQLIQQHKRIERQNQIKRNSAHVKQNQSHWYNRAWHWTQNHWGAISKTLSIVGLGVCIVASAGTCAVIGVGIAAANYVHNAAVAGNPFDPHALRTFAWDVGTTIGFGYLGKGLTSGWKIAASGERVGARTGWSLAKGWRGSPRVRVGVNASGAARRAGPRHGTRYALGITAENMYINAVAGAPGAGIQSAGDNWW